MKVYVVLEIGRFDLEATASVSVFDNIEAARRNQLAVMQEVYDMYKEQSIRRGGDGSDIELEHYSDDFFIHDTLTDNYDEIKIKEQDVLTYNKNEVMKLILKGTKVELFYRRLVTGHDSYQIAIKIKEYTFNYTSLDKLNETKERIEKFLKEHELTKEEFDYTIKY